MAIAILLSPHLCVERADYAQQLLVLFVNHLAELYGKDQLVYNVHGLVHLAAEAKKYGPLDNVSAFPFENYLGKLKKMIRKPSYPLQQIVHRISEIEDDVIAQVPDKLLWKKHSDGPIPSGFEKCEQYAFLKLKDFTIGINQGKNCVLISDQYELLSGGISGRK